MLVLLATSCRAMDAEPVAAAESAAPKLNPVAIATVGKVDPALAAMARKWVIDNTALEMGDLGSLADAAATFDEVVALASAKLGSNDVGVVVLFDAPEGVTNHGMINPAKRVSVVNVDAMASDDPGVLERRIQRQAIRGFGFLMGLETSPNPQSALAAYGSIEELDKIGRNFDPPWLLKLQERAKELGLAIDTNNPYFLLY